MDLTGSHYVELYQSYFITKKFRRSIEDVRTNDGADIASDQAKKAQPYGGLIQPLFEILKNPTNSR